LEINKDVKDTSDKFQFLHFAQRTTQIAEQFHGRSGTLLHYEPTVLPGFWCKIVEEVISSLSMSEGGTGKASGANMRFEESPFDDRSTTDFLYGKSRN
jgi:hypothetical protein